MWIGTGDGTCKKKKYLWLSVFGDQKKTVALYVYLILHKQSLSVLI